MATQLIKHLKNCAENDAIYKPLEYQWGFDEQLIAKALQNVSMYFPHYSRHDESHSRQILVHIERLLGENLTKLTATDTWLLLEAAYLHDIGMVVTDDQLNKNFEEIKQHAESMKYSADNELLSVIHALSTSKENTASVIFASVNIPAFQTLKLLREIIADYYRKKHPEQAGKIITHPLLEIGLDSPRNELLPARFFKLLSKICEYHGADFEKVMDLPQQQVGMGTENCHPRFVACLLRLGDLLDLDDNRFCPVMMKMAGDLPDLSKAHHEKHLAIRHFRADPDRIEITAECPDYESYIQTTTWFGWLRDEVKNQMSRWFEIVPKREFGLLPSVGDLKAHLKEWQVFSENQRPHFELDRDRIFELLQGAGLYECKEQAMRELLQNAVDATLIRIWREHGEDCQPKPEPFIARNSAPRDESVHQILDKYLIDVTIDKEKEEVEFNYWRITIADQGTGISREDLKFMMQMGSSKKNSKRRDIIEKMPVWMKPSGIFGIGLHSVFLLTNEVLIETRSIDTGETLVIRLTNPTDKKEHGNVYFQIITKPSKIKFKVPYDKEEKEFEFKPWDFSRFGSELSFIYKSNKNEFSKIYENLKIREKDGLTNEYIDFNIQTIEIGIVSFFKMGFLRLKLNNSIVSLDGDAEFKTWYYSYEQELEIGINTIVSSNKRISYTQRSLIKFYYRKQIIKEGRGKSFNLLDIAVNLLDKDADNILKINRNDFKSDVDKQCLFNRISKAIQDFFNSKNGKIYYKDNLTKEQKAKISAEYMSQNWIQPDYFNVDWTNIYISIYEENTWKNITIKQLSEEYQSIIMLYDSFDSIKYLPNNKRNDNSIAKIIIFEKIRNYTNTDSINTVFLIINKLLKGKEFKSTYFLYGESTPYIELTKTAIPPISNDDICKYCKKLFVQNYLSHWLKRESIPIILDNYNSLELSSDVNFIFGNNTISLRRAFELDLISPRMLFPLARIGDKISVGDLDILAKRVYKNRADKNTTEEQIRQKYQKFIEFLDTLMKDDTEWVELRDDEFKPNLITDNKN